MTSAQARSVKRLVAQTKSKTYYVCPVSRSGEIGIRTRLKI